MSQTEPPKIEFPCDYPIKVLGRSSATFETVVLEIVSRHAPGFDQSRVTVRASGKGTFMSLTVFITATGPQQLDALHRELIATGQVQMVI